MAVNLGTRGVDAARSLVEYCNVRARHAPGRTCAGTTAPRTRTAIKLWCLGNEMDGPWQIGHKTGREYGRLAAEAGRAMRRVDPSIELVACGSSHRRMPTFGDWERDRPRGDLRPRRLHLAAQLLRAARRRPGQLPGQRGGPGPVHRGVVATCDHVRAVGRHRKRIDLSFDEWNVWYQQPLRRRGEPGDRASAPRLIEDTYSVADAVVVGNLLISLLRHADRVKIGCLAQLVNVIAPIRTEPGGPAWRQTIFHPFALTSRYGRGTVLRPMPRRPGARHGVVRRGPARRRRRDARRGGRHGDGVRGQPRPGRAGARSSVDLRALPAARRRRAHRASSTSDPDAVNTAAAPGPGHAHAGSADVRVRRTAGCRWCCRRCPGT